MSISAEAVATSSGASAAKAWARALARTAPIRQHRRRIPSTVVDEMAETYTGRPAVISDDGILTDGARRHLTARLPGYARPVFLRLTNRVEATSTFKQAKTTLVREGHNPAASDDPLYVDDSERGAYVRVDSAVYERIRSGQMRA